MKFLVPDNGMSAPNAGRLAKATMAANQILISLTGIRPPLLPFAHEKLAEEFGRKQPPSPPRLCPGPVMSRPAEENLDRTPEQRELHLDFDGESKVRAPRPDLAASAAHAQAWLPQFSTSPDSSGIKVQILLPAAQLTANRPGATLHKRLQKERTTTP